MMSRRLQLWKLRADLMQSHSHHEMLASLPLELVFRSWHSTIQVSHPAILLCSRNVHHKTSWWRILWPGVLLPKDAISPIPSLSRWCLRLMGWWIWGGKVDTIQLIIALFAWTFTTRIQSQNEKCINCFDKKSWVVYVWSEASLCNVSRAVWKSLAPHSTACTNSGQARFLTWVTSMSFSGSAIAL